jgi:hypothetical protein
MRYFNKVLLILILSLIFNAAYAIDYRPGTSERIDTREYSFNYHNGTNDYEWFSTNTDMRWAVMFNFREAYPASYNANFAITKAFIYFPQIGSSATVKLFPNNNGQPAVVPPLATATANITTHNMTFNFPQTVTADTVWMVVEYNTDMFGPYIAASTGTGVHSYYLTGSSTSAYYANMAQSGFNCEFLFGLGGDFVTSGIDVALVDFKLAGDMVPQGRVNPTFRIYNHSNNPITSATIDLKVTSPNPDQIIHESIIPIIGTIPPHSELIVNSTTPGYSQTSFLLNRNAMQIRIRATLSTEFDELDIASNNTIVSYANIFTSPQPLYITENFIRFNDFSYISGLQDQLEDVSIQPLYYLPILSDTLSQLGALQRYNAYGYSALPLTIVHGNAPIIGSHIADYWNLFHSYAAAAVNQKTFISNWDCRITHPSVGDYIRLQLTLTNDNTYLYSGTSELNLTSLSRLYIGLFKKINIDHQPRYVFSKWITYRDTINTAIVHGSSITKAYNMGLDNISIADLNRDYVAIIWLQRTDNRDILFAASQNFDAVVPNEDVLMPRFSINVYPNPVLNREFLKLSFNAKSQMKSVQTVIYNMKGQKIKDFPEIVGMADTREFTIPVADFPASGIYFVRTRCIDAKGVSTTYLNKITIIK